MKANNGVLIIDDFGRQRLRPDELLNRWIVPLDRRIDFLTLAGGKKIEVPFEMLVVFASNNDPADLVDPAFLRRIQTKIKIGESTRNSSARSSAVSRQKNVESTRHPSDLIKFIRTNLKQELRSCYPRDIVNQVCWPARYEQKVAHMDHSGPAPRRRGLLPDDLVGTLEKQAHQSQSGIRLTRIPVSILHSLRFYFSLGSLVLSFP